ncbi:MAG: hypothetical protein K1X72_03930 [Pyrinomonadaceae bacterium]|nr:hypothetical protein [Pyrinomonadaceae bacterium]
MTETKKIKEINIEYERVRVVSNLKKTKSRCSGCQTTAEFISIPIAIQIFEITESLISNLANQEIIHLRTGINNEILVCLQSLLLAKESF